LFGPLPFDPDWSRGGPGKGFKEPHDLSFDCPMANERLKVIRDILYKNKKFFSESLIKEMVELTEGYEMSDIRDSVTIMVKELKTSSLDQDRYLECSTTDERRKVVEGVLLLTEKYAPECLIQDIVELTEYYDVRTVKKLVNSMAKKLKTNFLDQNSCIEKLRKAIDLFDEEEVKKIKFAQIEAIILRESLSKTGDEQEATTSSRKGEEYSYFE